MKKFSLFIAALALVLGTSQCKKEDKPLQNGEKQHIVLTANNGNDGSKVAGQFLSDELDLKWENGDVINVTGGATGTLSLLEGAGTKSATFEGDIEKVSDETIQFTVGTQPAYLNQTGADSFITDNICLVGFSEYHEDGNYTVDMELPYAVLKLNLSYFGSDAKAGVDVEIKVQDEPIAKVTGVTSASTEMFVAIPADNTEKTYVFNDDVEKKWTLAPNVFYTKSGSETGQAIVIEPATPTTPKFTVGMDGDKPITVEFAPGNLWYGKADGEETAAFHFEDNQWETTPTSDDQWNSSHVSHFKWSDAANAVTGNTNYNGDLFCASNFTVDGDSHTWRTLSIDEWGYLLGKADPSRADATFLCAWKSLDDGAHKGLVILPDGTKNPSTVMNSITSTSDLVTHDAVFLPTAGNRNSTSVNNVDKFGFYWSSTPNGTDKAYRVFFNNSGTVNTVSGSRDVGSAVRLVRDVK